MPSWPKTQAGEQTLITDEQTEIIKRQVGNVALDVIEDYFSGQAKARRRKLAKQAFVVGIVLGMVLRHAAGQKMKQSESGMPTDQSP